MIVRAAVALLGEIRGDLEHAERAARVAIAAVSQRDQRLVVDRDGALAEPALGILERAPQ